MAKLETKSLPKLTTEQVEAARKAKKGHYLTVEQLAEYMSRSVPWVKLEIKQGRIAPDATLNTGKRGRPSFLFKKGNHALRAKQTAKRVWTKRAGKVEKAAPVYGPLTQAEAAVA